MENPIHINIFDFDETLFRVPGYTCKEAKGITPYDWFDSPDSLDQKFNICGIENTIERTKDDCLNFLITHRVKKCQPRVLEILADNSIRFDKTFFLGRESSKSLVALDLIREFEADSITIFEDSLWEIIKYTESFILAGLSIDINFVFVDKSKVINLDWETVKSIQEFQQSERLKLI
jgi:hypothetical protein